MSFKKLLIPAAIGLGIYAVNRRAQSLSFIDYSFGLPNLRKTRIDTKVFALSTEVPITFDNSSPQQVTTKGVYLKLLSQSGNNVGNLILPATVITRLGKTTAKTQAIVNLAQLAKEGISIAQQKTLKLTAQGTIQTNAGNMLIEQPISIQLPTLPSIVKSLFMK